MKQITHFVNLLKPLGLYNLKPDSFVYRELLIYSEEMDYLHQKLQEIKGSLFVKYATPNQLAYFEQQLALPTQNNIPTQTRKQIISDYLSTDCNAFTLNRITQSIQSCGMHISIAENFVKHKIQATILSNPYHIPHEVALRIIKRFLPVHMELEITNQGVTWDELDKTNTNWTTWDNLDFTWNEFDVTGIPNK